MVLSQGMGIKLIKIISSTPVAGGCFISVGHLLGLSISPAWHLAATFISSQWCIDLSHWVRESHKPSSPTSSLPAILDREKSPIFLTAVPIHISGKRLMGQIKACWVLKFLISSAQHHSSSLFLGTEEGFYSLDPTRSSAAGNPPQQAAPGVRKP